MGSCVFEKGFDGQRDIQMWSRIVNGEHCMHVINLKYLPLPRNTWKQKVSRGWDEKLSPAAGFEPVRVPRNPSDHKHLGGWGCVPFRHQLRGTQPQPRLWGDRGRHYCLNSHPLEAVRWNTSTLISLVFTMVGETWPAVVASQNLTALNSDIAPAWVDDPNNCGTWRIFSSCIFTLVLFVWTAIHLNVPGHGESQIML